jgi:uncharacterized 2Fe-2S/4Fe-4S cluster protein (DUF4445 family)
MGGTEGAISSYDEHGYRVLGDVRPAGICGSGLIDIVAYMLEKGIVSPDGLLEEDFNLAPGDGTGSGISVTRQDIREVQLAKSAIAAGVQVLLKYSGMNTNDIDTVFLAGGFGNYINPDSAMRIGLISPEFAGKIISLGNTSGTGALLALKSTRFDEAIGDILARTRYIELSGNDDFTEAFALNMNF